MSDNMIGRDESGSKSNIVPISRWPDVHINARGSLSKTLDEALGEIAEVVRVEANRTKKEASSMPDNTQNLAVRGVSFEPLLGPIDAKLWDSVGLPTEAEPCRERQWLLHWGIIGGESGPHSRPNEVAWHESLVDQFVTAGVPVFEKQLGSNVRGLPYKLRDKKGADPSEWPEKLRRREFPI